jgi:hypothetical protein
MTDEQRANILSLADRCEAGTGGGRELDAQIAVAVSDDAGAWVVEPSPASLFSHQPGWFSTSDNRSHKAPSYTASLDAAMSLVPSGIVWNMGNDVRCWAHVWRDKNLYDGVPWDARASTPARALTAAALRAIAKDIA